MIKKFRKKVDYRNGQSIVEYIILVAIVVLALILFLRKNGPFYQSYRSVIQEQGEDTVDTATRVFR